jgi:hypothetical protein
MGTTFGIVSQLGVDVRGFDTNLFGGPFNSFEQECEIATGNGAMLLCFNLRECLLYYVGQV